MLLTAMYLPNSISSKLSQEMADSQFKLGTNKIVVRIRSERRFCIKDNVVIDDDDDFDVVVVFLLQLISCFKKFKIIFVCLLCVQTFANGEIERMSSGAFEKALKRHEEEQKGFTSFEHFPPAIPRDIFGAVSFGAFSLIQQVVTKDPSSVQQRDNSDNTPRKKKYRSIFWYF